MTYMPDFHQGEIDFSSDLSTFVVSFAGPESSLVLARF